MPSVELNSNRPSTVPGTVFSQDPHIWARVYLAYQADLRDDGLYFHAEDNNVALLLEAPKEPGHYE